MRSCTKLFRTISCIPVLLATGLATAQPANDTCATAQAVGVGTHIGDTTGATLEPRSSCAFLDDPYAIWYSITAPVAGFYTVDTHLSGSLTDTTLELYDSCGGALLLCNDDISNDAFTSELEFYMNAAQTYLLRVAIADAQGQITINITSDAPPVNDECSGAIVLPLNSPTDGSNELATDSASIPAGACGGHGDSGGGADVFFVFTPPSTGEYTFSTCIGATSTGSEDHVLSVHSACPASAANLLACNDDAGQACNGRATVGNVQLTGGVPYYVRFATGANASGEFVQMAFTLKATASTPRPAAPANDACAGATVIASMPFSDTVAVGGATTDATGACNSTHAAQTGGGVWYAFTASASGYLRFNQASQSVNLTTMIVYTGSCGALTEVTCGVMNSPGLVRLPSAGTYYLLVGQWDGQTPPSAGVYDLSMEFYPLNAATNDTCIQARAVTTTPLVESVETTAAGSDIASPCFSTQPTTQGVWYTYTAASNVVLRLSERSGLGEAVFRRSSPSIGRYSVISAHMNACPVSGAPVVCGVDAEGGVEVALSAGDTVKILVGLTAADDSHPSDPLLVSITAEIAVTGACCNGETCSLASGLSGCDGRYAGDNTTCDATDCCRADFNGDFNANVADIFSFLRAWFANSPSADFDGAGGIQVADIFAFLRSWFAGC